MLNHQNVQIVHLPRSRLQLLLSLVRLTFLSIHNTQLAKGSLIRFHRNYYKGVTIRSPEPSSGGYREAKKSLSDIAHSIKVIGGLSSAYSIVPQINKNKSEYYPPLSFSIKKYTPGHPEVNRDPSKKNHTIKSEFPCHVPLLPHTNSTLSSS